MSVCMPETVGECVRGEQTEGGAEKRRAAGEVGSSEMRLRGSEGWRENRTNIDKLIVYEFKFKFLTLKQSDPTIHNKK